jgi:hypothetical protein
VATEEDWVAYRRAVVDVEPPDGPAFRITPAELGVTGVWPTGLLPPVIVITAWDPDSVRLAEGVNRARHAALVDDLATRDIPWWPATGRDVAEVGRQLDSRSPRGHREEGVAATGLTEDEARDLARYYGQAAVYVWTPTAWEVVSCTDGRRVTAGWKVGPLPPDDD